MIKEKDLLIKITRRNITYYKKLNYDCSKIDKEILIKIEDVNRNSKVKITAICEICGNENKIMLQKYTLNILRGGYYGCRNCSRIKYRETNMKKYGVDNPMKMDEIKNKTFNTNMKKYGVKSTLQSKECNPLFFSYTSNKEKNVYKFIKENYNGKIY